MAELLFITPQEMSDTTILSGNVDIDKYTFCIANVQVTVIEPLLGTELYNKMVEDIIADDLTGLYLEMYTKFVKPITKFNAVAEYLQIASYILDNGGLYKHTGENIEVVDKQEAQFVSQKYSAMAQMYVQRFEKWICKNYIAEYKLYQDEVNAMRDIRLTAGWKLDGGRNDIRPWYLQE
jgi:hypothetical protein